MFDLIKKPKTNYKINFRFEVVKFKIMKLFY